jgi:hypothetical protein
MKLYQIPLKEGDKMYKIEPLTGSLIYFEYDETIIKSNYPKKLLKALELCNNPYLLLPYNISVQHQIRKNALLIAKLISVTSKVNFWASNHLDSVIKPKYTDSKQGIEVFRQIYSKKKQDEMCLPRSIFAASMSKEFRKSGVIFIGVFLPSKSMHAWIIENVMQPDVNDNIWINFKPVAAIC